MPSYVRAGIRKCARIRALSGDTVQSVHSKRFIRLLSSIIVFAAALDSVTFRGFVYGICTTDA